MEHRSGRSSETLQLTTDCVCDREISTLRIQRAIKKSEAFFRPLVVRISLDQERCKASPVISSINESNRGVKAVAGELSSPPANISAGALHEVVDIDRHRQTGAGAGTQEGRGCEAGVSSRAIIAPQEHKVGDSMQPRQMNRNNLSRISIPHRWHHPRAPSEVLFSPLSKEGATVSDGKCQ